MSGSGLASPQARPEAASWAGRGGCRSAPVETALFLGCSAGCSAHCSGEGRHGWPLFPLLFLTGRTDGTPLASGRRPVNFAARSGLPGLGVVVALLNGELPLTHGELSLTHGEAPLVQSDLPV